MWMTSISWGPQFCNYKEMNVVNHAVNLEEDPETQTELQPQLTLGLVLYDPYQMTQLIHVQTPDPQKLWDNKYVFSKVTKFVTVFNSDRKLMKYLLWLRQYNKGVRSSRCPPKDNLALKFMILMMWQWTIMPSTR